MALLDNIISYWKFDGASGDALDSSGNGYTLTNTNSVSYDAGLLGNEANFGTSNSNKKLNRTFVDPDSYNTGLSISFWFKISHTITSDEMFFGWNDIGSGGVFAYIIGGSSMGTINWRFGGSSYQGYTGTTYAQNIWYHLVMTHGASKDRLYLNGTMVHEVNSGTLSGSGTDFAIGVRGDNYGYFSGKIDEFGVWGRELTSTEVTEINNNGVGLSYPFTTASGPTNLKTFNGLDKASIKTINGLAIASVKSINGLT